jgi:hypothetical protein
LLSGSGEGLDPVRVGDLIAAIPRAMGKASVIRRDLSAAGNGPREAGEHLDAMDLDVTEAVIALRRMLDEWASGPSPRM